MNKGLRGNLDWYSNVPISNPVIDDSLVLGDLGGFVMTETGIRVGLGEIQTPDVYLRRLIRGNQDAR